MQVPDRGPYLRQHVRPRTGVVDLRAQNQVWGAIDQQGVTAACLNDARHAVVALRRLSAAPAGGKRQTAGREKGEALSRTQKSLEAGDLHKCDTSGLEW